jgi:hypothetical protein
LGDWFRGLQYGWDNSYPLGHCINLSDFENYSRETTTLKNTIIVEIKKWNFKKALIFTFGWMIGLFLLFAVVGLWGLKPLLSKRIKMAVLASTDSLYYLDFKDIKYEIMTGNAHISDVTLRADLLEGITGSLM